MNNFIYYFFKRIFMRNLIFILVIISLFFIACESESYLTCPDNVTRVVDLASCPKIVPVKECPDCNDLDNCTIDICNKGTDFDCKHEEVKPCNGNGICEEGEFPWSKDCPSSCDDADLCTIDTYSFSQKKCLHEDIAPCCGNSNCDPGETHIDCPIDCAQLVDVKVTSYREAAYIGGVETDLSNTNHIYLIVKFKIHNLLVDETEELDYKSLKGFKYDPYRFRVQDQDDTYYDVEYDSDLMPEYRDYDVIPKGHIVGAELLFIIPRDAKNIRLIANDKYGARVDVVDIY